MPQSGTDIFRLLTEKGYVEERQADGRSVQVQTELGLSKGIGMVEKISKAGNPYTVLVYPPELQKEVVNHYVRNRVQEESDSGADS